MARQNRKGLVQPDSGLRRQLPPVGLTGAARRATDDLVCIQVLKHPSRRLLRVLDRCHDVSYGRRRLAAPPA